MATAFQSRRTQGTKYDRLIQGRSGLPAEPGPLLWDALRREQRELRFGYRSATRLRPLDQAPKLLQAQNAPTCRSEGAYLCRSLDRHFITGEHVLPEIGGLTVG